jgi:putative peptidoglycan lipid II flippase
VRQRFVFHVSSTVALSIVLQLAGLARHILIAAYFGVARAMDGYLVLYALVTLVAFSLANVFDTVAVSRLVQIHDRYGIDEFWRSSNRLLLQAAATGVALSVLFLLILRIALPILAAGFSQPERESLVSLGIFFVPWIIVVIPYYAVASHLKALWNFHWVFGTEIVTVLVSLAVLWLHHDGIESLPIAYFIGYLAATTILMLRRGLRREPQKVPAAPIFRDMGWQHLANQLGTVNGLTDRFFQSFLAAGGISAFGYASQIVSNLSSLLTLREIYVVPLATEAGRSERVERVLKGVVLITIPVSAFVVFFSRPIIEVLFQRGQFDANAVALTSRVLAIIAIGLVASSVLAPLQRIFQITNKVFFTHVFYASWLLGIVVFQYLFMFVLKWDIEGYAIGTCLTSFLLAAWVAVLVRYCGVIIVWRRVVSYMLFAAGLAMCASYLALLGSAPYAGLLKLLVAGPLYGCVIGVGYLAIHRRIRAIVGVT